MVNSSERDWHAILIEEAFSRNAQKQNQANISRRVHDQKKCFWNIKICPVLDVFVSEDQDLQCKEINVSSPSHNPWSYCRVIDGLGTVFVKGGVALVQTQPADPDLWIGESIAFHSEITSSPLPDLFYPGQPDSARWCFGGPMTF